MTQTFSGQLTAKWREAHSKELLAEMEQQARLLNLPLPKQLEITP
jgi:type I restriction enzyme S subunit